MKNKEDITFNTKQECAKYIEDCGVYKIKLGVSVYIGKEKTNADGIKEFSFLNLFQGKAYVPECYYVDSEGKVYTGYDLLSKSPDTIVPVREYIENIRYEYGVINDAFNGAKRELPIGVNRNKDISLIYDHILNHICRGNEKRNEYVLNWIADIIKEPFEKKGTSLIIKGDQGTGKSLIFNDLMSKIFKKHFYATSRDEINERFNNNLRNKLLLCLEEFKFSKDKENMSSHKDFITGSVINIEKKGIDAFQCYNYCRVVYITNQDNPIKITKDDRRYTILEVDNNFRSKNEKLSSEEKIEIKNYFKKLADLINDSECVDQFIYDMEHREFDSNTIRDCLETEEKDLLKSVNQEEVSDFINKLINMEYNDIYFKEMKNEEGKIVKYSINDLVDRGELYLSLLDITLLYKTLFNKTLKSQSLTKPLQQKDVSISYDRKYRINVVTFNELFKNCDQQTC